MFEMAENPAVATETGANNGGGSAAAAAQPTSQPAGAGDSSSSALPFSEGEPGAGQESEGVEKPQGDSVQPGQKEQPGNQPGKEDKKETPKSVSDAINRAVERFKTRDAKVAAILKDAGLPEDFEEAAYHMAAATKGVPVEQIRAQQTLPDDLKLLGEHDAQRIIESGDIDAEIARLEKKPQAQRTTRDRECYVRLKEARAMNESAAALESRGVNVETLKKDQKFAEFSKKLNPELSIAEKYDLYKGFNQPTAPQVTPPPSVRSTGGTPKKDFYTSEEVDKMSREEVDKYFSVIQKSMANW